MKQTMSGVRRDYIASHLRFELKRLGSILNAIEEDETLDDQYLQESLRKTENGLRYMRRLCADN